MKILLINPNMRSKFPQPPLGLASIASVIRDDNNEVEIIDANALDLSEREVAKKTIESGAELVGITAMTSCINEAEKIAGKIKKLDKSKLIVLGGSHVSVLKESLLESNHNIDFVIFREGEETIVELIDAIKNNGNLKKIKGLCYRDGKKIITNAARGYIRDLDSLPMPAYDLLPIEKYRPFPPHGRKLPYMAIMTSRGCPFNCLFCYKDLFGRNYTTKSTKKIIEEIKYLVQELEVKEIVFYDDTFTLKEERVIELCDEMIKNDLVIPWSCETRVNLVNKQLLLKMKEAGCYIISYGIESGNQKILDVLRKGIKLSDSERAVKITKDVGIAVVAYFMIGCPEETRENMRETLDFAKSLDPDFAQFSICTPIPGSDLYKLAIEKGMKPDNWKSLLYVSNGSDFKPFLFSDKMSEEELKQWYSKAYKEFYLRPKYFLKALTRMRSLDDVKININGIKMLLSFLR